MAFAKQSLESYVRVLGELANDAANRLDRYVVKCEDCPDHQFLNKKIKIWVSGIDEPYLATISHEDNVLDSASKVGKWVQERVFEQWADFDRNNTELGRPSKPL
jgi:hypothetical protein